MIQPGPTDALQAEGAHEAREAHHDIVRAAVVERQRKWGEPAEPTVDQRAAEAMARPARTATRLRHRRSSSFKARSGERVVNGYAAPSLPG